MERWRNFRAEQLATDPHDDANAAESAHSWRVLHLQGRVRRERAITAHSSKPVLQLAILVDVPSPIRPALPRPRHPPLPPRRRRSQARQNSRIVPVSDLHPATCAVISAPVGLFREIQRHYITFRGHVWRSGALGFTPLLDGADWLDLRSGHNDVALLAFLSSVEQGDTSCRQVWESWQLREGRETYAYMTLDQLLTAFVVHSAEADTDTVLLPVHVGDIRRIDQHYYNRSSPSGWPTPSPMPNSLCCFKTYPATMWPHCDRHSTRCPTTVAKPACPACIRRSTRETTGHDRGRTQAGTSRRHKTDSPSTQGRLPRDGRQHRNGHLLQPTRYRLL